MKLLHRAPPPRHAQLKSLPGVAQIRQSRQPRLRGVLNATGVVVHTNLGRAPLAEEALARVVEAGGVEVDSSRYRYRPMYEAPCLARFATECPMAEQLTATVVACRLEAFAARPESRTVTS